MATPDQSRLVYRRRLVSRAISACVIVVGSLVLGGWAFDITSLKSLLPSLPTMKANTALGFILAGISLWLFWSAQHRRRRGVIAQAAAALVVLIALLTISQNLLGWDFGIDEMLFREPPNAVNTPDPGRMAQATAWAFVLVGTALVLLNSQRYAWLAEGLACGALMIGSIALTGYIFDAALIATALPHSSVALHTAVSFVALSLGVLTGLSGRGWELTFFRGIDGLHLAHLRRNPGAKADRPGISPQASEDPLMGMPQRTSMPAPGQERDHHHFGVLAAVGLIVVLEALSYWNTNALMSSMSRLEQTQQIIEALHGFGADLSTAEAATRAYLLSGDRGYVEPVDPAIVRANDVLRAVRPLIAGNPRQVSHFNNLEFFTANLVSSLRDSIAMQPHSASNDSIGADLTPGELMLMAEIRRVVTVMQREEKSLVVDRQRRIKARSDRILFTVLAGTVTSFAILGTVYYFLRREVRERQRAEHLLKRREETLHTLFESSPDAIVVVDRYGKIVRANQRIEEVFGYRPAELTGMPVEVLVPEHFAAQHVSHRRDYMTAPSTRPMGPGKDLCGKRKDGQEFPVEVMLSPAETDDGPITICVVRDISERKRTVAMLAERTEDLVRVNGELLRSNQELEDFAYIASHDLKEPLRGLHNYALFLMEDYGEQLDEEGRAKLSTLARLSQRMDALIDSLLEYSRVGRVDLAIGEIDLNAVVHEAIESLSISLRQAGIPIRIPQPLPTLRCDKARIGEVFRNLITNAMKYNDKEDKWMEIGWLDSRCRGPAEPSNGTSCQSAPAAPVLYVRDNGIGIAERYHESIFRIFKRLHGRDKYGGGTGAGLTIARRIIERHGGRIWVESSLGQGATFYFTLGGEEDNLDGKYERHTNHSPR